MMVKFLSIYLLFIASNINAQIKESADSLFMKQQWAAAKTLYTKYVVDHPTDGISWNRLGYCYQQTKQYNPAIEAYLKSLEQDGSNGLKQVVYSRLAICYVNGNQSKLAFESFNKAIDLGYSNVGELQAINSASFKKDPEFAKLIVRATENAFPCEKMEHAREFDFWIGEWNVFDSQTGELAGHSKIEKVSGGCAILENWTAIGGMPHNGKSLNFIDPKTNKWKQVWIGSYGINEQNIETFLDGEYKDNKMQFRYDFNQSGTHYLVRFTFFNEGSNQVRQRKELSKDEGATWTISYDYTYKRVQKK